MWTSENRARGTLGSEVSDTENLFLSPSRVQACTCDDGSAPEGGTSDLKRRMLLSGPPLGRGWDGSCRCLRSGDPACCPPSRSLVSVCAEGCGMPRPSSHPGDVPQLHGVGGEGKAAKGLETQQ